MKIKITLLLITTLFLNCGFSKNFVKEPLIVIEKTALAVIKNKNVQKYGATISGFFYVYYNSKQDATQHGGLYHIDLDGFHKYKHLSNTWGGLVVVFKTAGWLTGNYTLWELTKRTTYEGALWWQTWQNCYDMWKYDKVLDYRDGVWNDHRYVIPFSDNYIRLKSWQMMMVDAAMTTYGTIGLWKF